jgi:hypothetical protein
VVIGGLIMPKGNQSYFKSTNESVERYAIISKYNNGTERISGIYDKLSHLKRGLKNQAHLYGEQRFVKVKITIEEIEEVSI